MMSHDMEDIVAVLDGRQEIVVEVLNSNPKLKNFLQQRLAGLVRDARFLEALPGYMPGDTGSQARVPIIIQRLKSIVDGK